jgi:hypothetical protein
VSAIQNKDILSGALSAGVREALSPLTVNSEEKTQLLTSQLTGIFVGGIVEGEEGANNGYIISTSAEQYNRQLHQDEIKQINAQVDDFSNKTGLSKEESLKLLTIAAKYYNDKDTQMNTPALNEEQIEAGYISTTKYTKAQIDEAYNYLINNSQGLYFTDVYKEGMINQKMFTSTQEQFNNSDYNPNSSVGLEDSSLTFVPTVKVGQTVGNATKDVSPVIIKKTGQVYDDVTFGTINQFNNVAPNLTSKYLNNPTTLINNTNDFISSALPGIPENNWIGGIGWSAASAYYWEDTIDTVKKDIDLIKSIPTKIEQLIINHQNSQGNNDE